MIQRYGQIAHRCLYELYTSNESTFYERTPWRSYTGLTDSFMKLSDFNGLIVPLGYEQVELAEEYLVVDGFNIFFAWGQTFRRQGFPAGTDWFSGMEEGPIPCGRPGGIIRCSAISIFMWWFPMR